MIDWKTIVRKLKRLFKPVRCSLCGKRIWEGEGGAIFDIELNFFHDACFDKTHELKLWDISWGEDGSPEMKLNKERYKC